MHFEITQFDAANNGTALETSKYFRPIAERFHWLSVKYPGCIFEVWDESADGPSYPVAEVRPADIWSMQMPPAAEPKEPIFAVVTKNGRQMFSDHSMCKIVEWWNKWGSNDKHKVALYVNGPKPIVTFEMTRTLLRNFGQPEEPVAETLFDAVKRKAGLFLGEQMAPTVEMAMVLSTAHMPESSPDFGSHLICNSSEVAFVSTGRVESTPEWLVPIVDYADKHQFSWIIFDCDGIKSDQFKTYEWE